MTVSQPIAALEERASSPLPPFAGARSSSRPSAALSSSRRHLVHVFPTFAVGGPPVRMASLINRLGDGYRHTIVALDGRTDARSRLEPDRLVDIVAEPRSNQILPLRLLHLRCRLRALAPDLLLTFNWGAIEWALANTLLRVCRHVHLESGFGPEEADGLLKRRSHFRRVALRGASMVVVPSTGLVRHATRDWGVRETRIRFIPNGVDCAGFFVPPGETRAAPIGGDGPVIGTVAPLRAEKNVARLVRAFSHVAANAPARLVIVGDGPERPALTALAAGLGIAERVCFAGHREDVATALSWMDLFCLSSDTEQMPNALIQAMAAGRPVAAVDVGDVRTILSPENRPFVVARDDEGALARTLAHLLADADLRTHLGRCNQAHVHAHYSLERMVQAYEAVLAP